MFLHFAVHLALVCAYTPLLGVGVTPPPPPPPLGY